MVTFLGVVGVIVVLFGAAVLATREEPLLRDAPPDAADLALPAGPLQAEDVRAVRFGLTLRGYRMSEVDALLERVAEQLADKARQPPVQVGQAPVEIAPLPAGEPQEPPRH